MMNINNKIKFQKKHFYISMLCMFSFLFIVSIEIGVNKQEQKHDIIDIAWADDINGTENADNISGTINKDVIKGLNGNDTLAGKEAGDDISGGSGDDTIYGNEGKDNLKGKAGNDHIEGGEGNDKIYGDRGNDKLMGGPGEDTLSGGLGTDIFICGPALDTITDFNVTQKDTIPENDCENIEKGSSGSDDAENNLSIQQQQDSTLGNTNMEQITANTTQKSDEQKPDNGFFFGLFK